MSAPKVAIIVLVLLVALFAAGLGLGARNGDGNGNDTHASWLNRLQSLVNHPKQLTARDIVPQRPACVANQTLVILVNAPCDYTVPKATSRFGRPSAIRRASLTLRPGSQLQVQKFEGTDRANMPKSVDTTLPDAGKRDLDVDFYKGGGVLLLMCKGPPPCFVDLKT
jgi:hypothetical protein